MRFTLLLILLSGLNFCTMEKHSLQTTESVDLENYAGKWYDLMHMPAGFLDGCSNISAEYSQTGKNYLQVINRCTKGDKQKSIKGKAFIVSGSRNTKLKVQFFWPFRADYWILYVSPDYQHALVGTPSRKYGWILSRTPDPGDEVRDELLEKLKSQGFDIDKFERTVHN